MLSEPFIMPKLKPELDKINQQVQTCKVCNARKKGLLVPGDGSPQARLVFVGEAPGKNEIITGKPFVGRAGAVLEQLLESIKLAREDIFITSAVKYLPKTYITPKREDIEHGREHLFAQLDAIKPEVIVLMGNIAAQAVLQEKFSITQKHGTFLKRNDLVYFLSYHPAAPLYSPKLLQVIKKDFLKLKKYL